MRALEPTCSMLSGRRSNRCCQLRQDPSARMPSSRIPDRTCFRAMLLRLVTGCSWVDAEQLVDGEVSNTTLRSRRDEWSGQGSRSPG